MITMEDQRQLILAIAQKAANALNTQLKEELARVGATTESIGVYVTAIIKTNVEATTILVGSANNTADIDDQMATMVQPMLGVAQETSDMDIKPSDVDLAEAAQGMADAARKSFKKATIPKS